MKCDFFQQMPGMHRRYGIWATLMAVALAGCGSKEEEQAPPMESDKPEAVSAVTAPQEAEAAPTAMPQAAPAPPPPPPVLVKAGCVIHMPCAEEAVAAEWEKYAPPAGGQQPLLQNLYGGAEIQLPNTVYEPLSKALEVLRFELTPSDYAQLLAQVQYWWEKGRHDERLDEPMRTVSTLRERLEKLAQNPEDEELFPRVRVVDDKKEGAFFSPLVRHANGQMHYADERVFASLNNQNRYTASDIGEAEGTGLPVLNHFWDARTERLLLRTSHHADYIVPSHVEGDTYVLLRHPIMTVGTETVSGNRMDADVQMDVRTGMVVPITAAGKQVVPNYDAPETYSEQYAMGEPRERALAEASAAAGVGVRINTMCQEGEGDVTAAHQPQITDSYGCGSELRYQTCWGECVLLNLRSLTSHKVPQDVMAAFTLSQADETALKEKENEIDADYVRKRKKMRTYPSAGRGEDYSTNESTLQEALQYPLTFATKVQVSPGSYENAVLSDWRIGIGSKETIVFTAFAPNCFDRGYTETSTGQSVYTGVWHKGKAWVFTVPEGSAREPGYAAFDDKLNSFHREVKGVGRLVPLEEVARQKRRSADLLSWDDCELLVTEPGSTEDCAYLLVGGTKMLHRLKVNFESGTVEYLTSWPVKGADLNTAWLEDLRMLLLPVSDNQYNMLRMKEDGTSEDVGQLFITETDGYAVVLKDGRYAGSPGCEVFLGYSDGRQQLNMKALAPWRNRPAEVLQELGGQEEDVAALRATTRRWLHKLGYDADNMPPEPQLGEFPVAKVELPELFTEEENLSVAVRLRATARDLSRLDVLRDGARIPQPQLTESDEAGERDVTVNVPLAPGQNWIEITPVDVEGVAGETTRFRVVRRGGYTPNLFVVALGVADYDDDTLDLQYAAKDARDMAQAWVDCSGMQTRTLVLTDKEVKDAAVLEQIKGFLSAATLYDKVVLYMAGHGMLDAGMEYYYAPAAFDPERVAETGISADAIMDCLDSTAAHTKLLLLDTCHAGELGEAGEEKMAASMGQLPHGVRAIQHRGMKVRKTDMSYSSKKRYIEEMFSAGSSRRGINMVAASAGAEYALETGEVQNGVFTASVIEALREPAWRDCDRNGILTVEELCTAARDAVAKRTNGLQTPSLSMLENRGLNDMVYHPGHFILQKDWSTAEKMLKSGVRLTDGYQVRRMLSDGYYYNQEKGFSWVSKMVESKASTETIKTLLTAGLEAGKVTRDLWYSVSEAGYSTDEKKALVEVMLQHGVSADEMLLLRTSIEIMEMLLQQGTDANARDSETGETPLMRVQSIDEARLLLQHGADINARNKNAFTALDLASGDVRAFLQSYANEGDETAGLSAAQVRELGVDYAEARKGKPKNEQRAIQLYIKAADMGDMKAQRWMGWRYRQGRGVPKDEQRARAYFSAAARQGDKAAAEALRQ